MSVRRINLALYLLIAGIVALCWQELRWAASALPQYLSGDIGSPLERRLYRQARQILRDGGDPERARVLLERSVAIDPTCEAGYWLAEYYGAVGRDVEALQQYLRYIEIDPTMPSAYRNAARLLEVQDRAEEAQALVRRGLEYFRDEKERYRPRYDRDAATRENGKAVEVYNDYQRSATELQSELDRLVGHPAEASPPG